MNKAPQKTSEPQVHDDNRRRLFRAGVAAVLAAMASMAPLAWAGVFPPDIPPPPGSLKLVPPPEPANLYSYVADKKAAIILGKALFWDQAAGSDGLACASCHFQAGADNRVKNQLSPGLRNEQGGAISQTFNLTASNRASKAGPPPGGGPNYTLKKADYPFHQLADPTNANSAVLFDTDDVTSSQGVFHRDYVSLLPLNKRKNACAAGPSFFSVQGINVRQVEPRNTPTVINAVYNFRNFWDGRANNIFNGRNPFGLRDPTAGTDALNSVLVVQVDALGNAIGSLTPERVVIADASLASQSVGPPLSNLEMSCAGRVFEEIGKKMLGLRPLDGQRVDPTDSVLGPYANLKSDPVKGITGLTIDYRTLIKKAFLPRYWASTQLSADGYTQMAKNFSLFWGLALQLYEATLVSDNSPFDQYMDGNISAMTTQQVTGFTQVFLGKGGCIFCHKGAEFTGGAASSQKTAQALGAQVEHMIMGDGSPALYDTGFYNIGVRQPVEDIGIGGNDPFGNPLSWSRQAKNAATSPTTNLIGVGPDLVNVFTCNFQVAACVPVDSGFRDAVDGSFKVPTLRNVELTGPYFHNGGQATLEQVVDFYNRGGDATGDDYVNSTGYTPPDGSRSNPSNRAPAIMPLNLTATDKANLVAFLKALTDERVRWEMAPFDHPALKIPNGHPINENQVIKATSGTTTTTAQAVDDFTLIPAVGAAGRAAKKLPALAPFDANLR